MREGGLEVGEEPGVASGKVRKRGLEMGVGSGKVRKRGLEMGK